MPNPEQLEKEKQLIAFREEIQKLIDEAKEKEKRDGTKYNVHFAKMQNADSLTFEDMEWWEIADKKYSVSDFKDKNEYLPWLNNLYEKLKEYQPESSDPNNTDRKFFANEIRTKLNHLQLLEYEFPE